MTGPGHMIYFPHDWSRTQCNSLPKDTILDLSKLKGFADHKINVIHNLKFVSVRVENIVGKGENAGYQHFLLFSQCCQNTSFSGPLNVRIVCNFVSLINQRHGKSLSAWYHVQDRLIAS